MLELRAAALLGTTLIVDAVLAPLLPKGTERSSEHDDDGDQVRDPEVPVPDVREEWDRAHLAISLSACSPMGGAKGLASLMLAGALVAGCGSTSRLTASEFIDRINAEGVSIELGKRLAGSGGAEELFAVELPPLAGEPKPPAGSESGRGASGSLYVFGDTGGAEDQLEACRASSGLICFRAENIAIVLDEESSRLEAQRLAVAIKRLAQ